MSRCQPIANQRQKANRRQEAAAVFSKILDLP